MADENNEDEIEVVVAGEEGGQNSSTEDHPSGGPDVSPEEGIEQLKAKLRASEAARLEAENRARQAATLVDQEARRADSSDLQVIEGAINAIQQNNAVLVANKRALMAQGKWDAVCDIDLKIADNAAKLLRLEEGKQALEPTVRNPQPRHPQQQQQQTDLVEQYAAGLNPRSAAWIRSHPEFVTDQTKLKKLEAAHYAALGQEIVPDTDEYYTFVEGKLGLSGAATHASTTQKEEPTVMSDAAKSKGNRTAAPPPAAPPTRTAATNRQRVTLTGEEMEAAKASGLTPEEYWKNKQTLIKDGKLTMN